MRPIISSAAGEGEGGAVSRVSYFNVSAASMASNPNIKGQDNQHKSCAYENRKQHHHNGSVPRSPEYIIGLDIMKRCWFVGWDME